MNIKHTRMSQRNQRRLMRRDESGHGGGAAPAPSPSPTQTQTSDNQGGNTGDSGNQGSDGNNDGQEPDLSGFWNEPKDETGNGHDSNNNGTGDEPKPENLGQQLASEIDSFSPPPAFTADIASKIAEGKFDEVNAAFAQQHQQTIRQVLGMSTRIMQAFGNKLMQQVNERVDASHQQKDNVQTLESAFPSMKDPAVAPTIRNVFEQSMKHTKNDRTKAIAMTRDMLKVMGTKIGGDLGLNQAPGSREDSYETQGASSLVDELLGRS